MTIRLGSRSTRRDLQADVVAVLVAAKGRDLVSWVYPDVPMHLVPYALDPQTLPFS